MNKKVYGLKIKKQTIIKSIISKPYMSQISSEIRIHPRFAAFMKEKNASKEEANKLNILLKKRNKKVSSSKLKNQLLKKRSIKSIHSIKSINRSDQNERTGTGIPLESIPPHIRAHITHFREKNNIASIKNKFPQEKIKELEDKWNSRNQ